MLGRLACDLIRICETRYILQGNDGFEPLSSEKMGGSIVMITRMDGWMEWMYLSSGTTLHDWYTPLAATDACLLLRLLWRFLSLCSGTDQMHGSDGGGCCCRYLFFSYLECSNDTLETDDMAGESFSFCLC